MWRVAKAPKPVEMPYFGSLAWASSSMRARVTAMPSSARGVSSTLASPRATATTSSIVTPRSSSRTTRSVDVAVMELSS